MSESLNTLNRQQGDPLVFYIDLKWSLWTTDDGLWRDYAPETLKHLQAGFAGDFDEYGDTIEILTAPSKEIRYGKIVVDPRANLVTVTFTREFDDEDKEVEMEVDTFPLPETFEAFMTAVDEVEARLISQGELP